MTTVEELTQQVASLSKKNAELENVTIAQLEDENAELSSQVKRLEEELADPPAVRACVEALATLEEENEALRLENEGINQVSIVQYRHLESEKEMLEFQVDTYEENLQEAREEIAELVQRLELAGNTGDAVEGGGGRRRKRRSRKRTKKNN